MMDILDSLKPYSGGAMTKKQLRIIGGVIILFNLWLIGNYNLTGIFVLIGTVGVAVLFELVLIKKFASDVADKEVGP